ncbi:MAG: multidrug efflux SMR transporter, partial [Fibrobacter sp.]|nr:multidrug efflux SMR transporter [Fibrobacter sp.]
LLSAVFLSLAVKKLPLGTAYAIWTGLGTVGTFALGVYLFQEHFSIPKAICVLLILSGIVGLKLLHQKDAPRRHPGVYEPGQKTGRSPPPTCHPREGVNSVNCKCGYR